MRVPARWWIRASWVLTDKAWVTTTELERPTAPKLRQLWRERSWPGLADRAGSLLPGRIGKACDRRVVRRQAAAG